MNLTLLVSSAVSCASFSAALLIGAMLSAVRRRCVAILFSARPRYYATPGESSTAKNDQLLHSAAAEQDNDNDDDELMEEEEEEDFYGEEFDDDGRFSMRAKGNKVVRDEYDDDYDVKEIRPRHKTLAQREAALDKARAREVTKRGVVLHHIRPEPPVVDESNWHFVCL